MYGFNVACRYAVVVNGCYTLFTYWLYIAAHPLNVWVKECIFGVQERRHYIRDGFKTQPPVDRRFRPVPPPGGSSIETLYGDVPPKWVGFWQKIPKHGSFFFTPKSLNMGPFFVKIKTNFWACNPSPENFHKIPKHGSIFWAKSLNMGTFFTSKHGLGSRGPGGTPPSKPKSSTPPGSARVSIVLNNDNRPNRTEPPVNWRLGFEAALK